MRIDFCLTTLFAGLNDCNKLKTPCPAKKSQRADK